ncbi:ABC transporter permease [Rhizomonospora bruguierae]|uniref:ABC transporter permease n=1 Tax=Rhizomonospora bruguierae TaxID=1581705 RepID=UPI001BD1535B|nr:ABC transporter permease [Micromonospora sp. NBRC 107566]
MALTAAAPPAGRVRISTFARLKLRVLGNNFRGQGWRIALFIVGSLLGLWLAGVAFLLFLVSGYADSDEFAVIAPALGGAGLTLGWVFLPPIWFGVDETLDPARFALLPLRRRTLVTGLLVGALISVPVLMVLFATSGMVVAAGARGGPAAAAVQLVGVLAGLVLGVTVSRALTSALASMLRSRRMRDLAAIVLALLAAMLGPLQIFVLSAAQHTDLDQLVRVSRALGWTPLAAAYTVGTDAAAGTWWAVPVKLAMVAAVIAALLWWWSRSLESAMLGATGASGTRRRDRAPAAPGGAVGALLPRPLRLPASPFGALVAREVRYWWRDARRRANLITFGVVGIFLPLVFTIGFGRLTGLDEAPTPPPLAITLSMISVGALAAVTLANLFGFDGSAYAAHLTIPVPGRTELRARAVAYSVYIVPMLTVIAVLISLLLGDPARIPAMLGGLWAAYGGGLAVNQIISLFGAYALPETTNPFAVNTGAGVAKSLLTLLSLVATAALAAPVALLAALSGDAWSWLALPAGLGYGLGAAALGSYIGGDILDRRAPELLQAVTPRR